MPAYYLTGDDYGRGKSLLLQSPPLRGVITLSDYLRMNVMDEETPVPQKFGSLDALLMELNRAGHPDDQIWFYCNDLGIPEALQAADSRLIAERHANGSWWTVEGYHEANDPRMSEPEDALNVDEARGQLEIFFK